MRSVLEAPAPFSHFKGWMFSGRPLIAFESELSFRNCRIEMLPALETLVETSSENCVGGRRSSVGQKAQPEFAHTWLMSPFTSARISFAPTLPVVSSLIFCAQVV